MPFLTVTEFEVVPADRGSMMKGPGVYGPDGRRVGQLILIVDEVSANEIRDALNEEYGEWDPKLGARVKPNGEQTRKGNRG